MNSAKPEQFMPSQAESKKAESILTEEQRKASKIREKYHEQYQPPWEDFAESNIDKVSKKRKPPTPEQIRDMNQRIVELGEAFEGSDLNWHLDGALNISFLNGAGNNPDNYIGNHKDVDISVEQSELAELEAQLLAKGYGFFLSRTDGKTGNKVLRRVDHENFHDSDTEHMLIAAIDKNGKVRNDKALNFVDVHIIERNEEGEPLGKAGVTIPEKWARPQPLKIHDQKINLSHPGKVLYYKLHEGRDYDITDIQRLIETGEITEEDVDDVGEIYENEFKNNLERGQKVFRNVADKIKPKMSANDIYKVISEQPEFQKGTDLEKGLQQLAQKISESEDKSTEGILRIAITMFQVESKNKEKRNEIYKIRQQVKATNELKQLQAEVKKYKKHPAD
ncbi:hypothetical protein HN643_02815 [Candidatus Falkowbacteria bacterium]|nr:hypothetical protein [Candidatus Falkowbacteria bacterium]